MNKNVHISSVHTAFFRSITEEGWQIRIVSSANGLFIYIETSAHSEPFGALIQYILPDCSLRKKTVIKPPSSANSLKPHASLQVKDAVSPSGCPLSPMARDCHVQGTDAALPLAARVSRGRARGSGIVSWGCAYGCHSTMIMPPSGCIVTLAYPSLSTFSVFFCAWGIMSRVFRGASV